MSTGAAKPPAKLLILTKRQYTAKDLIDDEYGRLWELPAALARKGYQVRGLCLSYKDRKEGATERGRVYWQTINLGRFVVQGLVRYLYTAILEAKRADLIWACSDSVYGILGYFLARKNNIPLVFDLYDNFESFLAAKLPLLKQAYRYVIRKSDAVTCVSEPLREHIEKSCGRSDGLHVIENAVDKELFFPKDKSECRMAWDLPKDAFIIGTAGALTHNRGVDVLIEAFLNFEEKNPNSLLLLAGPKNITIPKHQKIKYLGHLPFHKVPSMLNALDVAVICNRDNDFGRYCFPQKAREMMACHVPIVAADIGSMAMLFKHHPDWLYSPDDADSLEKAIEKRLIGGTAIYNHVLSWREAGDMLDHVIALARRQIS